MIEILLHVLGGKCPKCGALIRTVMVLKTYINIMHEDLTRGMCSYHIDDSKGEMTAITVNEEGLISIRRYKCR